MPELRVVARGGLPTGERWEIRAGGTDADYWTLLRTEYPDGRSDEGGMCGPALYGDQPVNYYTGQADGGLIRVLARTGPQVSRVLLELLPGPARILAPAGTDPDRGLQFFAALLVPPESLTALTPLDGGGRVIPP
jgi:hypothetical protein